MLALIVSYFVVAYLSIPAVLFRLPARSILKKFQRTRTEEVTFAVSVLLVPMLLAAAAVVANTRCGGHSYGTWENYREILAASYSEEIFRTRQAQFWLSLSCALRGQSRFLAFLWSFSFLEGVTFLALVRNYGRWRGSFFGWFVRRLLWNVSEWYLLLTTANFPRRPERRVAVDVLTAEDHLYQGFVGDYFLGTDGELSGLLLSRPRRFDRLGYLASKTGDRPTKAEAFWKEIPGENLYLPRDKILSLNLRYPLEDESAAGTAAAATEQLGHEGLQLLVEPVDDADLPESE